MNQDRLQQQKVQKNATDCNDATQGQYKSSNCSSIDQSLNDVQQYIELNHPHLANLALIQQIFQTPHTNKHNKSTLTINTNQETNDNNEVKIYHNDDDEDYDDDDDSDEKDIDDQDEEMIENNDNNNSNTNNNNHEQQQQYSLPYYPHSDGNENYLELENWLNQEVRACNYGTVAVLDRNFIIKFGKRCLTLENLSKINKKISFDATQKTFILKIVKGVTADRHNAAIYSSFGINYNHLIPDMRKCTVTELHNTNLKDILISHNKQPKISHSYLIGFSVDNDSHQILSTKSVKESTQFILFRIKKNCDEYKQKTTEYKLEFRVFSHRKYYWTLPNWQKLIQHILTLEIYKTCKEISKYSWDLECWQGFYEPFVRKLNQQKTIKYQYFGYDNHSDGEDLLNSDDCIWEIDNVLATKYELYILLDIQQIETRLNERISKLNINLNDREKYPEENINGDIFIQFPLDAYIWMLYFHQNYKKHQQILRHIIRNKFYGYFRMIHDPTAGISNYHGKHNRIKHSEGFSYIWGQYLDAEKTDDIKGIRKQKNSKPHHYYTVEHKNIESLGEKNTFTMNASNFHHGPGCTALGNHMEDYKFKGIIWCKSSGDEAQLTFGARNRGRTNFLFAIPTPNEGYVGYESQGLCMTIAAHGLKEVHIMWKYWNFRIVDIYRFVKDDLIKKAEQHSKKCKYIKQNGYIVCKCIEGFIKHDKLPYPNNIFSQKLEQ